MSLERLLISFFVLIAIVIFVTVLGIVERIKEKEKFISLVNKRFGSVYKSKALTENKLNSIRGYFDHHSENSFTIDDITWADLSMDKIYEKINNTYTSAGEEYLYYLLRKPSFNIDELEKISKDADYFENNKEVVVNILLKLRAIGKLDKCSLYDYLDTPEDLLKKCNNTPHFISLILLILGIALIYLSTGIGIIFTLFVIFFNIGLYLKKKAEILGYLTSFKYIMRLYDSAKKLTGDEGNIKVCQEQLEELKASLSNLKIFSRNSKFVFTSMSDSGNILDVLMSYINMLLHIDLIMFNRMVKNLSANKTAVDNIVTNIGYIDAVIAVASYRLSLKGEWSKPCFDNSLENKISANNIYHPLINNAVKNSFDYEKCVLITGSNASGKSTFLRTIAVNQILSQTIYLSLSDLFTTGFYRLYSSMSLRDDLLKGDSYFMAEIKALKRILNAGNNNEEYPIMCFVDEVLRGTNTVERIASSTEVLKYFADNKILCFAATHDIELTELLEYIYENCHFEEQFIDGDIVFNYKLLKGKAESRNAIKLLETIGYDKKIVECATNRADNFLKTGVWS